MDTDAIRRALAELDLPGEELAPIALIATVGAEPTSAVSIDEEDRVLERFAAIEDDLGFLRRCDAVMQQPSVEEDHRLTSLLRWLVREFTEWSPEADPERRRLAVLFTITACCGERGEFWPYVQGRIVNSRLTMHLGANLQALELELTASQRSDTPYSDAEILERFAQADAAGDWVLVVSEWRRFGDLVVPPYAAVEAIRYLNCVAPDVLHRVLEQTQRISAVMWMFWALSAEEALSLALTSASPRVWFGAVLKLVGQLRADRRSLGVADEARLTQLFLIVASDSNEWHRWMQALNGHPLNYPQIQRALAEALITLPDNALREYIEAICLSTTGSGRGVVAECLRHFRYGAPLARRQALWRIAYERWSQWGFGMNESLTHLTTVSRSELDYAIVGYAYECMSAQERSDRLAALTAELNALVTGWHASGSVFLETVVRTLSCFQPYAVASTLAADDDWLNQDYRLPFDPRKDRYNTSFYMAQVWGYTLGLSRMR